MPELPEVETIAAALRETLEGARILEVRGAHPPFVRFASGCGARDFTGRTIESVRRQGKRIMLALRPRGALTCHLGMTGRIHVAEPSSPAAPHTHLRILLDDGSRELRFRDPRRFGGVWLATEAHDAPGLAARGPDALAVPAAEFAELLARGRMIKALLLDQRRISGLGNIYCDEALFAAGIHPRAVAAHLDPERVVRLHREIVRILRVAIRHRGSTVRDYATVEGGSGRFQSKHQVYGREGEPCARCGAAIRRIVCAGRSTHVCPRCQRAPRPARAASPRTGTRRPSRVTRAGAPTRAAQAARPRRGSGSRARAPSRASSRRSPRR